MKRIVAIFCVLIISAALFVPVFAGSVNQGTGSDPVSVSASNSNPDRSIGSQFVYAPGSVVLGGNTYSYDYTFSIGAAILVIRASYCPSSFLLSNNLGGTRYFVLANDTASSFQVYFGALSTVNYYYDNHGSYNSAADSITIRSFTESMVFSVGSNPILIVFDEDPQDSNFYPWYNFLRSSGVSDEWSSIGVVILSCLLVLSLVILVFKICFGRR